jgi:hypothetical protein
MSHYVRWRRDEFQYSSTYYQALVGACGHALSHQALNAFSSRDPDTDKAYPVLKAPE